MEKRLKHERNKLFLRIILILLAVWLTVSLVFCGVRLSVEKVNVQNSELADLSVSKKLLTVGNGDFEARSRVLSDQTDFVYNEDGENSFDTHVVITDRKTNKVIADERGLYIDKIIEQTDEVNGLVHRMLSYSKLDSYQMKLNKAKL